MVLNINLVVFVASLIATTYLIAGLVLSESCSDLKGSLSVLRTLSGMKIALMITVLCLPSRVNTRSSLPLGLRGGMKKGPGDGGQKPRNGKKKSFVSVPSSPQVPNPSSPATVSAAGVVAPTLPVLTDRPLVAPSWVNVKKVGSTVYAMFEDVEVTLTESRVMIRSDGKLLINKCPFNVVDNRGDGWCMQYSLYTLLTRNLPGKQIPYFDKSTKEWRYSTLLEKSDGLYNVDPQGT